jgi:hypothetical protein
MDRMTDDVRHEIFVRIRQEEKKKKVQVEK